MSSNNRRRFLSAWWIGCLYLPVAVLSLCLLLIYLFPGHFYALVLPYLIPRVHSTACYGMTAEEAKAEALHIIEYKREHQLTDSLGGVSLDRLYVSGVEVQNSKKGDDFFHVRVIFSDKVTRKKAVAAWFFEDCTVQWWGSIDERW